MTKEEAMKYIMKHPKGSIDELGKNIGKERLKDFEYLGYIKNGTSQVESTYQITDAVKKDYAIFYGKTTFCNFIPNLLFGVFFKIRY